MKRASGPVQKDLEYTAEALLGALPCQGSGGWMGELGGRDRIEEREREEGPKCGASLFPKLN